MHHPDAEAAVISKSLPSGIKLVIIGSTSFWGHDSANLCRGLAHELAQLQSLVVVTGGMDGVQAEFSHAYVQARRAATFPEHLFQLLPRGMEACSVGVTLVAGNDLWERREILGRVGDVCLIVEGGPGTEHEAQVATAHGIPLIPLARTGGCAQDLYSEIARPAVATPSDWALLNDRSASHADVIQAVRNLLLNLHRSNA